MSVFDGLAEALGTLLGADAEIGGFILGFVTVIAILIIITWVLGEDFHGIAILIPAGIAMAFVALVGWWPIWTLIFVALVAVIIIMKPFGGDAAG